MKIDNENVRAVPEQDVDRTSDDGKASSVQFIHFKLTIIKSLNLNQEIQLLKLVLTIKNTAHTTN